MVSLVVISSVEPDFRNLTQSPSSLLISLLFREEIVLFSNLKIKSSNFIFVTLQFFFLRKNSISLLCQSCKSEMMPTLNILKKMTVQLIFY